MALLAPLGVTHIYFTNISENDVVMNQEIAWAIVWSLSASWCLIFAAFLLLMKHEYVRAKRAHKRSEPASYESTAASTNAFVALARSRAGTGARFLVSKPDVITC